MTSLKIIKFEKRHFSFKKGAWLLEKRDRAAEERAEQAALLNLFN